MHEAANQNPSSFSSCAVVQESRDRALITRHEAVVLHVATFLLSRFVTSSKTCHLSHQHHPSCYHFVHSKVILKLRGYRVNVSAHDLELIKERICRQTRAIRPDQNVAGSDNVSHSQNDSGYLGVFLCYARPFIGATSNADCYLCRCYLFFRLVGFPRDMSA